MIRINLGGTYPKASKSTNHISDLAPPPFCYVQEMTPRVIRSIITTTSTQTSDMPSDQDKSWKPQHFDNQQLNHGLKVQKSFVGHQRREKVRQIYSLIAELNEKMLSL